MKTALLQCDTSSKFCLPVKLRCAGYHIFFFPQCWHSLIFRAELTIHLSRSNHENGHGKSAIGPTSFVLLGHLMSVELIVYN